jgi:RNA polymerase sigma-70 factor, ECF subfamily
LEDERILILFREDPKKALSLLYDKYFDYLSKEIFFILKNEEDTRDVIQDLFLTLWYNKDHLNNINTSLKLYLRKAAYNKSLNKIKTKVQFFEVDDEETIYENGNQHSDMVVEELNERIKKAIDQLPFKCRTVFLLSRYDEKSYREIAESLEISIKTVENQISKALKILRKKIDH